MKIINPGFEILAATPDLEKVIERGGRVCYKSEDKITDDSAEKFVAHIRSLKHESVLEHGSITVLFICDRGVTHELVRHRIASFSQESTRYVNYSKGKFGSEITVIDIATGFNISITNHDKVAEAIYMEWHQAMLDAEKHYMKMVELGATAQLARSVLPNSLKTEIVVTANPREFRHIFKLRCDKAAHPQMIELMKPVLKEFISRWPALFKDLEYLISE